MAWTEDVSGVSGLTSQDITVDDITADVITCNNISAFTANGAITLTGNLISNTGGGVKLATAASQKLGFWGQTPVVRQSAIAPPSGDSAVTNQDKIIAILTLLEETGFIATYSP